MKTKIKLLSTVLLAASFFAITGCKTIEGLGEDIESLGQSMQDSSSKE